MRYKWDGRARNVLMLTGSLGTVLVILLWSSGALGYANRAYADDEAHTDNYATTADAAKEQRERYMLSAAESCLSIPRQTC
jgi:hypothetical protein